MLIAKVKYNKTDVVVYSFYININLNQTILSKKYIPAVKADIRTRPKCVSTVFFTLPTKYCCS